MDPAVWLRGDEAEAGEGARLLSPYSQSAWVYIAVSVLAETVAQIPFRIARLPASAARELRAATRQAQPALNGHPSLVKPAQETAAADASRRKRILSENIIERGPVVELFDRPHPTMDRALFWEMLMTWRALRGEFFIVPLDDQDQPVDLALTRHGPRITRLITLAPEQFWHIVQGYELAGWRFTGGPMLSPIASQVLLPSEVVHSRSPNPYLYWRGLSPLLLAMLPAAADYAAEQFMKGLMVNNADTGVIVTTEQQVSADQREAIMGALRERKRKAGTPDRPLFLWGGAKLEKPGISSADMQFLENRKLNRQEIGAIFKVPESMMGFSEQKHSVGGGSSMEQERLTFIENSISSHCGRLECAVGPILKSFGPDLIGYFDIESLPLLQAARRQRLDAATKAFGMGVPFNEINAVYDLGFKALPWGDTGFLPANLQEAGTAPAGAGQPGPDGVQGSGFRRAGEVAPAGAEEPGPDEPEQESANPIERVLLFLGGVGGRRPALQPLQADRPLAHNPQLTASAGCPGVPDYPANIAGSVRAKKGKLSKFFFEQRNRVLGKLASALKVTGAAEGAGGQSFKIQTPSTRETEKLGEDGRGARSHPTPVPPPHAMGRGPGGEAKPSALMRVSGSLDELWDAASEDAELENKLKAGFNADLEFGAAELWKETGLAEMKLPPSEALNFLQTRKEALSRVNATTWAAIKSGLADGWHKGQTPEQLADRVKGVFQEASESRAEAIAAAETNIAINAGRAIAKRLCSLVSNGHAGPAPTQTRPTNCRLQTQP